MIFFNWNFNIEYFCSSMWVQESQRRQASETNEDLSDCAKKGIAGESFKKIEVSFPTPVLFLKLSSSIAVGISLVNLHLWNIQWNHGEATLCSSSAFILMLFQTHVVCMEGALSLKVRNGQQPSGFMSILSTRSWETIRIVLMSMLAARDGLNSASAQITRSIWWDLPSFLATAGKVVRCVDKTLLHSLCAFLTFGLPGLCVLQSLFKNTNGSFLRAFSLLCFVTDSMYW